MVELRRTLLLPLDDLVAVTREFINPDVSRSGMDRCLRRHGVSVLKDLVPVIVGEEAVKKTFKDYRPGFLHVDIKYLPQMPDETAYRLGSGRARDRVGDPLLLLSLSVTAPVRRAAVAPRYAGTGTGIGTAFVNTISPSSSRP